MNPWGRFGGAAVGGAALIVIASTMMGGTRTEVRSVVPPASAKIRAGGIAPPRQPAPAGADFHDDFDAPELDTSRWTLTEAGDFEEIKVDSSDGRLLLRCATRGTRMETVKFAGVRSAATIRLIEGMTASADVDWNDQENGCYLTAGLVLAPALTSGNPLESSDFLRVDYVGVPPGKNARLVIAARKAGRDEMLFTDGWPDRREGRAIVRQRIEIMIRPRGAFSISENGRLVFESKEGAIAFDAAHLYLQMSSHSNYGPREIFFDNVRIER